MAPVDPGSTIHWSKNPSYTTSLVNALLQLPDASPLFQTNKMKSPQWKQTKQNNLESITRQIFTAGGDSAREKKQRDSITRRITALGKEYSDGIQLLKQDPFNVDETLAQLVENHPYWDDLRTLLKDHPDMPEWDEDEDRAKEDEDERQEEEEEEEMQDIDFYHQRQPQQPIAGPSNHRNQIPSPLRRPQAQARDLLLQQNFNVNAARVVRPRSSVERRRQSRDEGAEEEGDQAVWEAMLRERRQAREDADRLEDERRRRRIAEAANAREELQAAAADLLARNVRRRSASPPVGRRNSQARARFADDDDDFDDDEPRRWRPRDASSPERMPAFQQTPPRPVPPVPAQPRNVNDDDALTSCPKCQLSLLPLTPSGSEAHIRRCFDGGPAEGAHLENCPVCERSLVEPGWTKQMGEKHVDDCCKGLGAGGGGGGGGGAAGGGGNGIQGREIGRGRRDHVVFVCDKKSVPKDDKTGEPLECSFCLEEFEPEASLARLSCYCIYHETCVNDYWQQPGKFCPLHRDLDDITEVEMN